MAGHVECSVEVDKDGVKLCRLHKKPLLKVTAREQSATGESYPKIAEAWQCPVSGNSFLFPKF